MSTELSTQPLNFGQVALRPPVLEDKNKFKEWRRLVSLWGRSTAMPPNRQAPAVVLQLRGEFLEVALGLDDSELESPDGLKKLISKFDDVFGIEEQSRGYEMWCRMRAFSRKGQSLQQYIAEFQRVRAEAKNYNVSVSDEVFAYMLLEGAGCSPDKRMMVMSVALSADKGKITVSAMEKALRRLSPDEAAPEAEALVAVSHPPSFCPWIFFVFVV